MNTSRFGKNKMLYERFKTEVQILHGNTFLVAAEKLPDFTSTLIAAENASNIFGQYSGYLNSLKLKHRLAIAGRQISWLPSLKSSHFDPKIYRRDLSKADLAITSADFLVAQTGTVVLSGQNYPGRLLTLLPPSLFVIAPLECLVPDLSDVLSRFQSCGINKDSSLTFITGPSRTADIEKTLVIGVHGPKKLTVLVVDE